MQKHSSSNQSLRRWRRMRVYPVLALWLSVCGVAACRSTAAADPPPQAGGATEATPAAQKAKPVPAGRGSNPRRRYEGPILSEAQWEQKAYALIDGLRQRTDLTPAHIQRIIGMKLLPDLGDSDNSYAGGATTIGGAYGYSPTCTFDFARVKRRLERRGFEGQKSITDVPYWVSWLFMNQDRVIFANFRMVKRPGEDEHTPPRLCLARLELSFTHPKERQ